MYLEGGGQVRVVEDVIAANQDFAAVQVVAAAGARFSFIGDTLDDIPYSTIWMRGYFDSVVFRDTVLTRLYSNVFCDNWGTVPATFDHDDIVGQSLHGAMMSPTCGTYTAANHDLSVAPTFVAGSYVPAAGSVLVDAGVSDPLLPSTDLAGAPRTSDGNGDGTATVDIGAYERP